MANSDWIREACERATARNRALPKGARPVVTRPPHAARALPAPAPGIPFTPHSDGRWSLHDPESDTTLWFSDGEMAAFVDGAKRGEFDHLVEGVDRV